MKPTNKIIAVLISIGILYFIYAYMLDIIGYILIAWVLSMIGAPVVDFLLKKLKLEKLKFGHSLSAIIVIMLYLVLFSLLFIIILPPVVSQVDKLIHLDYDKVFTTLQKPIERLMDKLVDLKLISADDINPKRVKDFFLSIFNIHGLSNVLSSMVSVAGNLLMSIFSVGFITFFFLKEKSMFSEIITSLVPERYIEQTLSIIQEVSFLLKRYFSGILLQVIILMTYVFIVLSLFGIEKALVIAFFAAVINIIPYIGPLIGATFGLFIVLTNNLGMDFYDVIVDKMVIVLITFATMQALDNYILQPMIYSDKIKAHPLEIFIVILVGAKIYGIVGMVLAIPTYIVFRAIAKVFLIRYRAIQKITS